LLGLVAGLLVFFRCRFTGGRFIATAIALLGIVGFAYGGRQLAITTESGTGQQRIQLWLEGFSLLRRSPIFGIGMGNFVDQIGLVAHNSFVQCFVEMGFIGGTLFVAAWYLAWREPYSFATTSTDPIAKQLLQFRPCILAIVASAIVGMLSSTRSYSLPTYLVLGLAAVYVRMIEPFAKTSVGLLRRNLIRRMCMISAAALVSLYVYARVSVIWES
jgi:O-antigen ligase